MDYIKKLIIPRDSIENRVSIDQAIREDALEQTDKVKNKVSIEQAIREDILEQMDKVKNAIIENGKLLVQKNMLTYIYMKDIYAFKENSYVERLYYNNKDNSSYSTGYLKSRNETNKSCQEVCDAYKKLFNEYYTNVDFICYTNPKYEGTVLKMIEKKK